MFELLEQVNHWHWLAFGLALLALELVGTAGYFLWIGISAMLVGALLGALPIGWQMQWLSFASFSLITTWLWWRRQLSNDKQSDANRDLNQREKQLVGQTVRLTEDIQRGNCRIKVGDSSWSARASQDIQSGTEIKIVALDGIVLIIEPL
ncbi:NfeD family protein [Vibrio sp. L3-7]|uniref:NfeD family protein n=1 Tax=Vibrio sp. L3-7 TaxID=2912253 RepID=UPI001197D6D8|nr:NfeD family protein [Vibrio sp. L3-7]MCF7504323.1 NfeD family protein [Vibrio sp. L3-7]TVU67158.1 NfeD family protein [Vibrio tasmaniensis]